eukprot:TRINITY_DN6503_c0_g1_i2.p1 TRINITY_DN6503_c0_g1~~TRINITY_DN6503_c0_g1_i2.p1  ORF type:complete len:114 (+),score=1.65 TRINITY_DN6503_c0_g1_i2:48-344(+)
MLRFVLAFALFSASLAAVCKSPKVSSESFTAGIAAMFDETSYSTIFTVDCDGALKNEALFAYVNGQFYPVAAADDGSYQVTLLVYVSFPQSYRQKRHR